MTHCETRFSFSRLDGDGLLGDRTVSLNFSSLLRSRYRRVFFLIMLSKMTGHKLRHLAPRIEYVYLSQEITCLSDHNYHPLLLRYPPFHHHLPEEAKKEAAAVLSFYLTALYSEISALQVAFQHF